MFESIVAAGPSLADTAYKHCIDLWIVFSELDSNTRRDARSPFWRLLKPDFRHVECWKYLHPGAWLRFNTGIELITFEVHLQPPWELTACTPIRVQRQVPYGYWREPFFIGPVTCVEQVKAFLGMREFFVRTPFQLYRYLTRRVQNAKGFGASRYCKKICVAQVRETFR